MTVKFTINRRLRTVLLFPVMAGLFSTSALVSATTLTVMANGEKVGFVKFDEIGNEVSVDYHVDNNGRGPKLHADVSLSGKGIPVNWEISGRSLMGGQVTESYRWDAGSAIWQSQADSGQVSAAEPVLYITNDSTPWETTQYVKTVWAAPDHRLAVLPAGELTVAKLQAVTLPGNLHATVYRMTGRGLTPDYVLLDDNMSPVAVLDSYQLSIREGLESELTRLSELYGELEMQRVQALQKQLAHRHEGKYVVRNAWYFDAKSGTRKGPVNIVVDGGKISAISDTGSKSINVQNLPYYDAEGGTVIPGLNDMHSHTTLDSGLWYLAAGVTNTRDMGNNNPFLLDLMKQMDEKTLAGPRIVKNGFLEGRSPYSARLGYVVDSEKEALEKVRWYHENGFWQIKIYNSINPDWVPAITTEAHKLGMGVTGHIPAFTNPDAMVSSGYDEITHINQLMLGWLLTPEEDTRTPLRLTAMQRAANLDLDSKPVQRTMDHMEKEGVPLDPTAVILERLMLSRAGEVSEADAPYLSHMPIGYQRYRKRTFVPGLTPEVDTAYRESFSKLLEVLKRLHERGIQLLPGTDDTSGFTVHRELELYVKAGLSPAEALIAGTLGCAQYMEQESRVGSIEAGKQADLVILDGNPLEDISAVRHPRLVVKDDQVYSPAEIYTALGVKPFAKRISFVSSTGK